MYTSKRTHANTPQTQTYLCKADGDWSAVQRRSSKCMCACVCVFVCVCVHLCASAVDNSIASVFRTWLLPLHGKWQWQYMNYLTPIWLATWRSTAHVCPLGIDPELISSYKPGMYVYVLITLLYSCLVARRIMRSSHESLALPDKKYSLRVGQVIVTQCSTRLCRKLLARYLINMHQFYYHLRGQTY